MSEHPQFQKPGQAGRIICTLCPRFCELAECQRGLCFVRQRIGDQIQLTTYGRSSGFVIDPIEKKPLNHFYPGSSVLSFGTAGCNLSCKFCQNWDMSKSRQMDTLQSSAQPMDIALAAQRQGCKSVAFTYNDPVIFYEYAVDTAQACHELDIKTVAVTAGYITPEARPGFFEHLDAANVDLKGFSEKFYRQLCAGSLAPVLETLKYLVRETNVWTEITNLLIPGENDSDVEITALVEWLATELGSETPLHFSAFHPDYKLLQHPPTSHASLIRAKQMAERAGLKHVYLGNVVDSDNSSTYCPECGAQVIQRDGYQIRNWLLDGRGSCTACGTAIAGHFDPRPQDWGNRRERVII